MPRNCMLTSTTGTGRCAFYSRRCRLAVQMANTSRTKIPSDVSAAQHLPTSSAMTDDDDALHTLAASLRSSVDELFSTQVECKWQSLWKLSHPACERLAFHSALTSTKRSVFYRLSSDYARHECADDNEYKCYGVLSWFGRAHAHGGRSCRCGNCSCGEREACRGGNAGNRSLSPTRRSSG